MTRIKIIFVFLLFMTFNASGQNLLEQKIRKLSGDKKSIYFRDGIFHNGSQKIVSSIKSARHSYKSKQGYERFVVDFGTQKVPKIYGFKAKNQRKIFLDIFNTHIESKINSFGNSKFIRSINYFGLDDDKTSLEVNLKKDVSIDVFYLESPGRLVIDIKG